MTAVIVGASVGGVRTAQSLRSDGFQGHVVLIGAEPDIPYDKPPLSKHFLTGEWDLDRISLLDQGAADAADIELRLGVPAERLDPADRLVLLADGTRIPYDVVVVATGAAARPSPWVVESGVHVVRTVADSVALRDELAGDGPVVVVGGGFIGAEVAATARAVGHDVTVVDPLSAPIGRVLGTEIGLLLGQVHGRHGVHTRFGVGVQDVAGRTGDLRVTLTDGEVLRAATVVVGIGAVPNVGWLASSGLLIDNGVVCDEFCRAVDRADVYAVGDVARWFHQGHGEHVRVEHWTNAVEQAACVAYNITHPDDPRAYRPTEYVWSDQYDWRIQIVGRPHLGVSHEVIGDPDAQPPRFAALYRSADDRLGAVVTVNWPKALVVCRRLIGADADYLEGVDAVRRLAPAAVRG